MQFRFDPLRKSSHFIILDMKKIFILSVLLSLVFSSYAQLIENKLNIGAGLSGTFPLNKDLIETEGFYYPSLWRNYGPGVGALAVGSYKLGPKWWMEASFEYTYYFEWENTDESFILHLPQSQTKSYSLGVLYLPIMHDTYKSSSQFGFHASALVFQHFIEWEELLNTWNNEEIPLSDYQRNAGIKLGVTFVRERDNYQGTRVDLSYSYVNQDSFFYLDKAYHAVKISAVYYLKFLKNRYYQYE